MTRILQIVAVGYAFLLACGICLAQTSNDIDYVYDDLHRLVRVSYPDGMSIMYYYDAVGNRIRRVMCLNTDQDPACNIDDCRPEDETVFDSPHQITGVRWRSDKTTLEWNSDAPYSGSATTYDVLRGLLADLPVSGALTEYCLDPASADTTASDAEVPAQDACFYYVVRGDNECGTGSYGEATGGSPRSSPVCP
jgi:YD repeat-containing protein